MAQLLSSLKDLSIEIRLPSSGPRMGYNREQCIVRISLIVVFHAILPVKEFAERLYRRFQALNSLGTVMIRD